MNRRLYSWIEPLHRKYRREKCDLFLSFFHPAQADSLLDVGGGSGALLDQFDQLYRCFDEVQVVNLRTQTFSKLSSLHIRFVQADGCALPYPDQTFDWVFSNAVIEHVGTRHRQSQFASEIRRVARKGYFIATPNRHFPIDPHTLLPFYQYLPPNWQRLACNLSLAYTREYEPLHLLSVNALRRLFPGAQVRTCGFTLYPNNLIAFYKKSWPGEIPGRINRLAETAII
jgi:ubiquinone/menaquinone biosynthesis C-methylase UbiE